MPRLNHASPVRHLKAEAIRTIEAMQAGRIPWAMGEACLQLIRIETADILKRNLLRLHGKPSAPERFSVSRRKVKPKPRPKRPYVRRQILPPHLYREIAEHPLEPWLANEAEAELS